MTRPIADPHIAGIHPYVPGKQVDEIKREYGVDDVIKMASNENPLGASPAALEVFEESSSEVHIYPDGAAFKLNHAISQFHDVPADQILTGNGSDQLLRLAVQALARPGEDHGVLSRHSFGAYPIALQAHNVEFDLVEMAPGLRYDLDGMAEAVGESTRIVFIANPNNPTGTYVGADELRSYLEGLPEDVVAVVDEAYTQYVQADDYASALQMRDAHDLLIVTRTFSKCYGLAGLRIGYAIAPPAVIDAMNRIRAPFNTNRIGQEAAIAALQDEEFVDRSVSLNERGRRQLEEGFAELEDLGVDWTPSQTNFLLIKTPHAGREVYERMLYHGVIVRPMAGYGLPNHLRITIGTEEQNARCLEALEAALEEMTAEQGVES
jgi:histidinol-phosphate aminotransferase